MRPRTGGRRLTDRPQASEAPETEINGIKCFHVFNNKKRAGFSREIRRHIKVLVIKAHMMMRHELSNFRL